MINTTALKLVSTKPANIADFETVNVVSGQTTNTVVHQTTDVAPARTVDTVKTIDTVSCEMPDLVSAVLTKGSQNIKIEYSDQANLVPHAVENLALRMLKIDPEIRDFLKSLRALFASKKETFHYTFNKISKEGKAELIDICKNLCGVITEVSSDYNTISGKIVLTQKAQTFINGQYMEIAVRKIVSDMLAKLEKKHGKSFKLYANTKVVTKDGKLKNEFDLIVENVTDSILYVIEVKSGKNFYDFDKLARIGREYKIVPNRLLLVQNYLTTEHMETIEYFCEYYCANLEQNNLEQKLTTMIENDL